MRASLLLTCNLWSALLTTPRWSRSCSFLFLFKKSIHRATSEACNLLRTDETHRQYSWIKLIITSGKSWFSLTSRRSKRALLIWKVSFISKLIFIYVLSEHNSPGSRRTRRYIQRTVHGWNWSCRQCRKFPRNERPCWRFYGHTDSCVWRQQDELHYWTSNGIFNLISAHFIILTGCCRSCAEYLTIHHIPEDAKSLSAVPCIRYEWLNCFAMEPRRK